MDNAQKKVWMGLLPKKDKAGFTLFLFWVTMTRVGLEDPTTDSTAKCSVEDLVGWEEDEVIGSFIMGDWPQSLAMVSFSFWNPLLTKSEHFTLNYK